MNMLFVNQYKEVAKKEMKKQKNKQKKDDEIKIKNACLNDF